MADRLRLAVVGDPHISHRDADCWAQAIDDINGWSPAAVLVLGDLTGYGPEVGTSAATRRAVEVLAGLRAPWFSVIGNHDLEADEFATDEASVASFLQAVGRETPWFRADLGPLTVLGLSTTSYRRNEEMPHEVVFEDDQLAWCDAQLAELADRPVFIIAHVPPIGSGLMTMAELHAQSGNAVANQNHFPGRVMKLVWRHPNVLAWFSGHNHLGQHYREAIAVRLGVHFVHTGVAGRVTRDGRRHSRVVDIYPDRLEILTFDHEARRFDEALRYCDPHSLSELLEWRRGVQGRTYVSVDPETMRQGPPIRDAVCTGGER